MWILPLIVIGLVVYAASSHRDSAPLQLEAPRFVPPPGPIAVLGEVLRIGHKPPPPLIMCAIAEAESIGRNDLASDIVRTFVAPVVQRHELERARKAKPQPSLSPAAVPPPNSAPVAASAFTEPVPARGERSIKCFATRGESQSAAPQSVSPRRVSRNANTEAQLPPFPASDAEIHAMLNADPERFVRDVAVHAHAIINDPNWITNPTTAELANRPVTIPEVLETVTMAAMDAATRDAQARAPIDGVRPDDWSKFCDRLARESPEYKSSRHVGQYRQRVDRLIELGIDPITVMGSVPAQRAALDTDLADACYHARASGLTDDHLKRLIAVPGANDPQTITLSGLLGVIQSAGLDGAVGWLENKDDRKRYPHTTAAFLKTNGIF